MKGAAHGEDGGLVSADGSGERMRACTRGDLPAGSLPSGRHGLSPEYVAAHQRERLLRAVCESCAARGYSATTIADIVRLAGVSPRTFYRHFRGKEECFIAAYLAQLTELEARVTGALRGGASEWPERACAALRVLLDEFASHPPLARTLFVDVLHAGPRAHTHREQALGRCHSLLPLPPGAPPEAAEAALGGIVETIYHTVLRGHTAELAGMCEELAYCLLVPLVGHERALAASRAEVG